MNVGGYYMWRLLGYITIYNIFNFFLPPLCFPTSHATSYFLDDS